ncbi:hypothetical protein NA57DRAFT_44475 [Rhizodiscina lignyota]|uniref:Glycoside hydrolase family 76 protein n=1 Tax=Rhizodiscina lignyota TaxID=1504668 RepID=A0A9P4I634_9PEZI|nr:hypothetical protein NA57DRAFT_44475 [Rhizodiscina lignyota]
MLLTTAVAALFTFSTAASGSVLRRSSDYLQEAISTAKTLQKLFYHESTGLWTGVGPKAHLPPVDYWFTSANCLSTIGLLASLDNGTSSMIDPIIQNSYVQAQAFNLGRGKSTTGAWPVTDQYADALIWAMAWVHTYDLIGEKKFLDTVVEIFQYVAFNGANATCGGVWSDVKRQQQDALTNDLFLAVSTHLATRVKNGDYYLDWAVRHWKWYESSGLLQPSGLVVDYLDTKTCVASGPSYSHIQGILVGGLLELNKAVPSPTYIDLSVKIVNASMKALSDSNGILTEYGSHGSPNIGTVGPIYKGLYIRHVVLLASKLNYPAYIAYVRKQADSIWASDRSRKDGTIGNVWDHYYEQLESPGHCSGLDALVAAATVS